jgi:cytochrome-b5 reductase
MFRYTPTSLNSTTGYFDLVVKAYPPGGGDGVSSYITSLKPGDNIEVKGCYTKKKIVANQYKQIGLIAGGSGLTPMLQVAQELLNTVEDETKLSLLFANVSPDDVYLKDELDELATLFPERFSVTYVHSLIPGIRGSPLLICLVHNASQPGCYA